MIEDIIIRDGEGDFRKKTREVGCDVEWEVCHQQLDNNKVQHREAEVWVMRQQQSPTFIHNYLELKCKGYHRPATASNPSSELGRMLIGRMHHICTTKLTHQNHSIELNSYSSKERREESPLHELKESFIFRSSLLEPPS